MATADVTTRNVSRLKTIDMNSPSGWIKNDQETCNEGEIVTQMSEEQCKHHHEGIVLVTMWKGITRYAYINGKETKHRTLNKKKLRNFDEISALSSSRVDVEEVVDTDIQVLRQRIKSSRSRSLGEFDSNEECQKDLAEKTDPLRALKDRIVKRKISITSTCCSSASPQRKNKGNSDPKWAINNPKKSPTSVVSIFEEEKKDTDGYFTHGEYVPPFLTDHSSSRCSEDGNEKKALDSVRRDSLFSTTESITVDLPETMKHTAICLSSSEPQGRIFCGGDKIIALKERIRRKKLKEETKRSSLCSKSAVLQLIEQPTTLKQPKRAPVMCTPEYFKASLEQSRRQGKKQNADPFANKNASAATGNAVAENDFYLKLSTKSKNVERPTNFSRPWLKDETARSNTQYTLRGESTPSNTTRAGRDDGKEEVFATTSNEILNVSEMMNPISYFISNIWSLSVQDQSI